MIPFLAFPFCFLVYILMPTNCEMLNSPEVWSVLRFARQSSVEIISGPSYFLLECAPENATQRDEWGRFMDFLQKYERVKIFCPTA